MFVCRCVCLCVSVASRGQPQVSFLRVTHRVFWNGLSLLWKEVRLPGWLARELQASHLFLPPQSWGSRTHYWAWFCNLHPEDWVQVLMLAQQPLCGPGYFLNPFLHFVLWYSYTAQIDLDLVILPSMPFKYWDQGAYLHIQETVSPDSKNSVCTSGNLTNHIILFT